MLRSDRTTAPYIVGTFFLKILMHTKPAVCFLALGCELRYNTADRARARAKARARSRSYAAMYTSLRCGFRVHNATPFFWRVL